MAARHILRGVVLLLVGASLGACGKTQLGQVPPTGSIDGYLCVPGQNTLAVGATVQGKGPLGPVRTTTNDSGYFMLLGLAAGAQDLAVSGNGYTDSIAVIVVKNETVRLPDPDCLAQQTGALSGRICADANGINTGQGHWLAGARVYIDTGGQTYQTTTAADGSFTLSDVPVGQYTLNVQKGSFAASAQVTVTANQTTQLDPVCIQPTTRLGVVTGQFDAVQDVLANLGFTVGACLPADMPGCPASLDPTGNVTLIDGSTSAYITQLLEDPTEMGKFDVLFFNCGLADAYMTSAPPDAVQNLQAWVKSGKAIYVSDWAYEILRVAFPGVLNFYGDASVPHAANVGMLNNALSATIVEPILADVVGTGSISLDYNKGDWVVLQPTQPSTVRVWVKGNPAIDTNGDGTADTTLSNAPLLVTTSVGQGRIVFTTFHVHQQTSSQMQRILEFIVFEL